MDQKKTKTMYTICLFSLVVQWLLFNAYMPIRMTALQAKLDLWRAKHVAESDALQASPVP